MFFRGDANERSVSFWLLVGSTGCAFFGRKHEGKPLNEAATFELCPNGALGISVTKWKK